MHDLQRWCKYTFTYPSLLQEYSYLRKQVASHDTVSKVAYVSNFTYVSKSVHVNGALECPALDVRQLVRNKNRKEYNSHINLRSRKKWALLF